MGADIAVKHLAIVADGPDRIRRPGAGEAERLAELAFGPDQPLDRRLLRLQRVVDRLRADDELLLASRRAKLTHLTILNHRMSSCRTTGPSRSFEMTAGRIM